jgi:hypothetical protein
MNVLRNQYGPLTNSLWSWPLAPEKSAREKPWEFTSEVTNANAKQLLQLEQYAHIIPIPGQFGQDLWIIVWIDVGFRNVANSPQRLTCRKDESALVRRRANA